MVAMAKPQKREKGRGQQGRDHRHARRRGAEGERDEHDGARDGGVVSGALQYVKERARAAGEQIRRSAGEATGAVLDTLLDEAEQIYEQQRKQAVSRVSGLSKVAARSAHALHAVKADAAARYVEEAAKHVERSSRYLRDRELTEVLEDAGDIVRRHQMAAAATMFVLGFAATRFLKASASGAEDGGDQEVQRTQPTSSGRRRRQRE
jgi:hypothetical protein